MYIAKNNARSQLAGTLLIAGTTATLDAGDGALFAVTAPEWTYATFFDGSGNIEHVKVTARATDALTIVRAQDGTAAREWPVGTYIECRPIAAALADYAVAPQIDGATAKATPVDADEFGLADSAATFGLKKVTWANINATLKTYFDTLYHVATGDVTLAAGANLVFEGSTDDGFETTVSADDPTADRSITLPDYSGAIAVQARGADITSAATVDLDAATGDIADVTGTTAVTAITLADGVEKSVRFTGVLTLTKGASLILPGAANITTADGDVAVFRGYAAGLVRCVSYSRASGQATAAKIVQVVEAAPITTVVACSAALPRDDTIPQSTEGGEVITVSITPTNASNRLRIEFSAFGGISAGGYTATALFQDSGANAIAVQGGPLAGSAMAGGLVFGLVHEMEAGSTSATTFKIRVGADSGTIYINGQNTGSRQYGGVGAARLRVTEILGS